MNRINKNMKRILFIFFIIMGMNVAIAAQNIIDVSITEKGYEEVFYNPLKSTDGVYVDANENRSVYSVNGTIFIKNNHETQAVQDTVLNITGIENIYNLNQTSGRQGYIIDFNTASNYALLLIPDLGSGQNSTFTYDVNTTNIGPAINFTTSYSDSRTFAGLPITVTDNVQNTLDNLLYPDSCIYDINITQIAMEVNEGGLILNNTFDAASKAGTDAANAIFTPDNKTINWNLNAGACLNSGASTDINYDLVTPIGIAVAGHYEIINTSIKYSYNKTFSRISVENINSNIDLDLRFDKFLETFLNGDNATWRINGSVINPTNITVNLTTVNYWVSVRDGTGTGFTNPSIIDNDTVSGASLTTNYPAGVLLNNSLSAWDNSGDEWYFNYTSTSSPIVWMDVNNFIVDDGIQLSSRNISYGENNIFIKEIYIATGYWLQIFKNITRLSDNNFNVFIEVKNLGTSPTPSDQIVQVYNFIPASFALTSPFEYSLSAWYDTVEANETLSDPVYNGTMYQFGLIPLNSYNSSLDALSGPSNSNNTWTLTYNITGSGEFNFDDLFLTGLDPLHVSDYGSTQAVTVEGIYGFISSKVEVMFAVFAGIIGAMALFF